MAGMRYAIYYAPQPGTQLHRLGSEWLGRDAFGHKLDFPVKGLEGLTVDAARYGLHATLKAPFVLQHHKTREELGTAVAKLADRRWQINIGKLALRNVRGFLALVPEFPVPELKALEKSCLQDLDSFRLPQSAEELARRRAGGLSARQERNLEDWGYPFVLEDFHFHITLTRRMSEGEVKNIKPIARKHFEPAIGRQLIIDSLSIFRESVAGQPFVAEDTFSLQALAGAA